MFKHLFGGDRHKTFKPLKGHKAGTKQAALHDYARATLGSGDMRAAVSLPEGEDESEWLATHTVDFFNTVSLLYGTVAEFCTPESCPTMSAGPKYEYLWADGVTVTKPMRVPAAEYVDLLLSWIEGQISNEAVFPTAVGSPFPKNFRDVVKTIFKRLFRVFAHIYYTHFDQVVQLSAEAHLNTSFKHFALFVTTFSLVDAKELAPLADLIDALTQGQASGSGATTGLPVPSGSASSLPAAGAGGAGSGSGVFTR